MAKNSELAHAAAINAVTGAGYIADGETRSETVRMPTMECPISNRGKSGGELATFGGRQRFAIPGTPHRVTVGPRTTNFYQFETGKDKEPRAFMYFDTADLDGISRAALIIANKENDMANSRFAAGGLEPRFTIERTDGKPIPADRRYSMVLDFSGNDPHAVKAANAYADSVEQENPALANGIRAALADPENAPAQHRYADR